jgi:hypothetical protein
MGDRVKARAVSDAGGAVIVRLDLSLRKGPTRWFYDPEAAPKDAGAYEWERTSVAIRDRDGDGTPDDFLPPAEATKTDVVPRSGFVPIQVEDASGIAHLWNVAISGFARNEGHD